MFNCNHDLHFVNQKACVRDEWLNGSINRLWRMSDRLGRKQRQDSCITNCAWEIIFILLGYFTIFHLSDLELESSHSLSSSSQQSCSLLFHATAPSPAAYIFQVQSSPFALSCLWTVLHKHMTLKSARFKVQGSRFRKHKTWREQWSLSFSKGPAIHIQIERR